MAQFVISEKEEAEISALCNIARHNGSVLTLGELLEATAIAATEEDLETAWRESPVLSSTYALDSGWILEKSRTKADPSYSAAVERQSEERSRRNIQQAREFARLCVDERVRLLAVSGGNSYSRAGPRDDIDLFSVVSNDSVWIFMLRSLLLARLHALGGRGGAPFCFSYVVEERKARRDFHAARDGLFARDALMAHVISGSSFYRSLLSEANWMENYFPKLYQRRMGEGSGGMNTDRRGLPVLNSFLFYTVGTYIRLKAFLLNAKYRKRGKTAAIFRAEVGKDRCVYESTRYVRLRRMYGEIRSQRS